LDKVREDVEETEDDVEIELYSLDMGFNVKGTQQSLKRRRCSVSR